MLHGLLMDAAFGAYITIPAILLLIAYIIFEKSFIKNILKGYSAIIIFLSLLITTIDLFTYQAWRFRLNDRPIYYLMHPKEAAAASSHLPLTLISILYLISVIAIYWVLNKRVLVYLQQGQQAGISIKTKLWQMLFMLLLAVSFIIPARGGFQQIPINQSSVYFTDKIFYNHAATNVCWVFVNSLVRSNHYAVNPFIAVTDHETSLVKSKLFSVGSDTGFIKILKKDVLKPNIIFIVWESLTDKATKLKLGNVEVTPHFNNYKKEGIYFSNIYATGDRTDKGIVATLSGFPAQPITSIIQTPQKVQSLPVISNTLYRSGYKTSFYYGGELEFANLKAYVIGSNFSKITTVNDFKNEDLNSKWGAHDNIVAKKIMEDLQVQQSPFFLTWLTLSSHEPFEIPFASITDEKDVESLFLNSHHYMDSVLFTFIEACKKLPSWQNTLVVISADHGHPLPTSTKKIDDFKIPLLLLGGALKNTNLIMPGVGSQIDIPTTVLAQLGMPTAQFKWGKNLFNPTTPPWAYFCFDNGYGFVQTDNYYIFDNIGGKPIETKGRLTSEQIIKGKVVQQLTFQDYMDR